MLHGYLISNTSNAKIGSLFYLMLSAESLYNRLQSLIRKLLVYKIPYRRMILNIPCYREIFSNTAAMHLAQRNLQNEWSTKL